MNKSRPDAFTETRPSDTPINRRSAIGRVALLLTTIGFGGDEPRYPDPRPEDEGISLMNERTRFETPYGPALFYPRRVNGELTAGVNDKDYTVDTQYMFVKISSVIDDIRRESDAVLFQSNLIGVARVQRTEFERVLGEMIRNNDAHLDVEVQGSVKTRGATRSLRDQHCTLTFRLQPTRPDRRAIAASD